MYLKRLEIQGFKSFADKVDFAFDQGVTAIVGPNGSGKSNVVDSIRWVLGEQSAKNLRGGKMDDVIFAGSTKRRPVGMAQVILTLDNSNGLFPLDFNEITIARRLYRSGESEYLINQSVCRLKDIHELFMDTGLGREGFSIISQGKVDEILSLKAEDRRGLIEEAAGIIKYKYRKRDAEKKLADTEESMIRINDIISELSAQVGPLGEQAEKARQHRLWKSELDDLEISLEVEQIERSSSEEKEFMAQAENAENQLAQTASSFSRLEAELAENKLILQQLERQISDEQDCFYQQQNQLEKAQNELVLHQQRKADYHQQKEKLSQEAAYFANEKERLTNEKHLLKERYNALKIQLQTIAGTYDTLHTDLSCKTNAIIACEEKLEQLKVDHIQNMQVQAKSHNELLRLQQLLANSEKRLSRIDEKADKLQQETLNSRERLTALQKDREQLAQIYQEQQQTLKTLKQQIILLQEQLIDKQHTLETTKNNYQRTFSRYTALKELEDSGDGYQVGVRAVLEQKRNGHLSGIVGTVAQLIQVPQQLERAIETAIGQGLQNIITENDHDAQKAISYLKSAQKGRATFLPLNTIHSQKSQDNLRDEAVLGLAVDLITFDKRYQAVMNYLLGRVWVVRDLAQAVRIGKQKGFNQRLVTLEGELVTPGGALTGGNYAREKTGLLSRKRQIDELFTQAQELKYQLDEQTKENRQISMQLTATQNHLEETTVAGQDCQLKTARLDQQLRELQSEQQRLAQELSLENLDRQELNEEIIQLEHNIAAEQRQTIQHETDKNLLEKAIAQQKNELTQLKQDEAALNNEISTQEIQLARDQEKQNSLNEQLQDFQQRLNEVERQYQQKINDIDALAKEDQKRNQEIAHNQAIIKELTLLLQKNQIALTKEREIQEQKQLTISEKETHSRQLQKQLDTLKEQKHIIDTALTRVRTLKESGLNRLAENFELTLAEALLHYTVLSEGQEARRRVQQLKNQIKQLGEINFNAIEEFTQVKERLQFLQEQIDDLTKAKQSLNRVIKEMEIIMAEKFHQTYQVVNEAFASVFKAMFSGGQARLELSDPQDYLLTGIEIVAQPPGKKEQILSLLSGGERAMTAIALLFALLTVKPSPFCILDEIEAALDEVNVERFARFIREYTHKTQFIIISHRKGTMEAADVLYGVTMENDGVSRLMSVKLSDYQ